MAPLVPSLPRAGCGRRAHGPRDRSLVRIALLAIVLVPAAAPAQEREVRVSAEYDLKAAFLFRFTQFVDWPPEAFAAASTPITIGVLGADPFGNSLDEIVANEVAHNRRLLVRRFRDVEDVDSCQVLFIGSSEAHRQERVLSALDHRSILTVGETADFTTRSGMIGFVLQGNRLRLSINLSAVRAARLTVSSKLLRQARIVAGGAPGP